MSCVIKKCKRRARIYMDYNSNWTWPDIPGLHDFNGPLIHSANWPKDFNYDGLTVAVIGNGATGVQIVPAILSGEA